MSEVLVIGGAGFLGQHLVRMLVGGGHSVRILSRRAGEGGVVAGVRYFKGEVADVRLVSEAVKGTDAVYDLAANTSGTWEEFQRAYIEGARNVSNACIEHGVRRFVYASTIEALDLGVTKTIDESAGVDPRAHLRPGYYHLSKIVVEKLLLELSVSSSLPLVILRPGIIVGPGGTLRHAGIGRWRDDTCCTIVGKGMHPLPFVLVQDAAAAFRAAMTAPGIEGRTFNLVGDVRPSAVQMVDFMRQRSRRNFRAYPQNLCKLYAILWFKYLAKTALRKNKDWPTWHALKCEQMQTQLDCSAAKKCLDWKPVADLETFLQEAIDPHLRPILPGDLRLLPYTRC
jgi:nucleoside-diphosphate-sugar epimerase